MIGIMQGRLLPKYKGRYQAHPVGYWEDEFWIAQKLGLNCIEFIFDYNDYKSNPLIELSAETKLKSLVQKSGIQIKSICADYFMEAPLHSENSSVAKKSSEILVKLIKRAGALKINDIVLPCVDKSSLTNNSSKVRLINEVMKIVPLAEKVNVNLSLETDLDPKSFAILLSKFNTKCVKVNYDIGNSASLGFDTIEELKSYGDKISVIHIKDRTLGGGSVVLGRGNADFKNFFFKLKDLKFKGPFIMQAYRDDEGIEIFKKQLHWIKPYLETL